MRPLRLEVEGFMGWRRRQAVDLVGLELFALVGPTGAGKSSLIDAICFALYGTVPRLEDRRQVAPVVHQAALEARVRLDFAVGGERYTVARVVRRQDARRATTREARLERNGEVLAGDADGVTRAVEEVLGLTFDHFVRSVVLPQGEFARLLHDAPGDRDKLLKELVGAGIYERVRERADALAKRLEGEVRAAEARLAAVAATPEALTEAEARVGRLEELAREAQQGEGKVAELAQKAQEAREEARAAGERAERLAAVRIPEEVAEVVARLERARQDLAAARRKEEEARARLDAARRRRSALPEASAIQADLAALSEAEERARQVDEAEGEVARRREELELREEAARTAGARAQEARDEESRAGERLRELRDRLRELPTPDRLQTDLAALDDLEWRRAEMAEAERAWETASEAWQEAERRLAGAQAEEVRAREAWRHLGLLHAAREVASRLEPGDPCPVCGRPLEQEVSPGRPEELVTAERAYRAAADELANATHAAERARERRAEAQTAWEAARAELDRAKERTRHLPSRKELERQLAEVEEARQAEEEAARSWEAARARREEAEKDLREAEAGAAAARERRAKAQTAWEAARAELDRAKERTRHLPSREELERRLAEVEEARRAEEEAAREEGEARRRREETEAALVLAKEAEQAAWNVFRGARDEVADCSPPAPPGELAPAWEELAGWAAWRAAEEWAAAEAATRRAEELEAEAGRLERELVARLREAGVAQAPGETASVAAARAAEAARGQAERLRRELDEAARLRAEADARKAEQQVALSLERELRSDGFPRWLLEEALGKLVEGASEWLRELSRGRYSLDLDRGTKDVRFVVVDHVHADQRRPVRTLSGGETFLASLALALALGSHVASLAARPGALETLFLDEGFGTLDPESLDVVATALEDLAAGDRMVGVVTHVPEVAERVPVRFEVRPGPDGPTLERVEA